MKASRVLWGGFIALVGIILGGAYLRWVLTGHTALTLEFHGQAYELLSPRLLGLVLISPLILFVMGRSLADLPWQQRVLSTLLRLVFVALLALALSRPARNSYSNKICTVYVVDVSDSVPPEALSDADRIVHEGMTAKREEDLVRLVTFAKRPRAVSLEGTPDGGPRVARHSGESGDGSGSDLQAALQHAQGLFPAGYLRNLVILSDGIQTSGNALAEAQRLAGAGVRVHTIPYRHPVPGEVALQSMTLPDHVKVGQPFQVRADVYSSRDTDAEVTLFQGEAINGLDGIRKLTLKPGLNELSFESVVRMAGSVTYRMELTPKAEDRFSENNRFATTVDVPGRPTVLYVEGTPTRASYLSSALNSQQFDVDVRAPTSLPASVQELERYDFVVLSDVPASAVSHTAQDAIEQYVKVLGGGLLFAGGESGYGLGGWSGTPMERILPVTMDTEHRREMPTLAIALVIDRSGSMTGLPLEMAKAAARATVEVLSGSDLIEVIAFDSIPNRYVKMTPANQRARIDSNIAKIQSGGGTDIFTALDAAYQDMVATQARRKHVVLLTDGRASTTGIRDLVQTMVAESISITTVGLGEGADDEMLSMISDLAGGRYHKVLDPNALPRVFTKETEMVARESAREDWFPVTQVSAADFLEGLDIQTAPLLHGYVATQLKPAPAQLVLQSDTAEPILARWRVGTGWTLAWTSDVKNLWAVEWLRWKGYGPFWGQLVHEHMRVKHRRELDMQVSVTDGEVHAVVDAFAANDTFENGLVSTLELVGPQPQETKDTVAMRQTAPGRYEGNLRLSKFGSYLVRAVHTRPNAKGEPTTVAVSYGHVSNPYPAEYSKFEADAALLTSLAQIGMGKVDPSPAEAFSPGERSISYHDELWMKVGLGAIAVFLLDLFLRRVRLFDRKFLPRKVRSAP